MTNDEKVKRYDRIVKILLPYYKTVRHPRTAIAVLEVLEMLIHENDE
jgi:hypothetical protein